MRCRRLQLLCAVLALLSIVCVCPLGRVVPGGSISSEARGAVLDDLKAFADSQPGADPAAERQALLERLRSRPELTDSGVAVDGSVWGRFTDGIWLMFPTTMTPPDEGASQQSGDLPASLTGVPKADASPVGHAWRSEGLVQAPTVGDGAAAIPESKEAMLLTALDPRRWGSEEGTLKAMLDQSGYHAMSDEMTVDRLKAVRDVGVLYIHGHGGLGGDWSLSDEGPGEGAPGDYIFAIGTSTPYTKGGSYAEDLNLGRLAILYSRENTEYRLGFTGAFVAHYMSLSQGSFVYLGSCSGSNLDIQEGFREAGASVMAAWTYPVAATNNARAVETTFDLLLGNGKVVNDVKPLNRPFEYGKASQYLAQHRLDQSRTKVKDDPNADWTGETPEPTEESPGEVISMLRFTPLNPGFQLLSPSIRTMDVILEDQKETLVLHGIFGEDPGTENRKTTIGGQTVEPSNWASAEEIHVPLRDADKEGGSGDVVVEVYGHKSNAVPLTLWHGELRYKVENLMGLPGVGETQETITFDVYIRADVHAYRNEPSLNSISPQDVQYVFSEPSKATTAFQGAEDIGCTFSVSGEAEMRLWQPERGEEPEVSFNGYGAVNAGDHTMTLRLAVTPPKIGVLEITCPQPVGFEDHRGLHRAAA